MSIPLRLLIVEDSEDDTLLLVRELRHGGYDVTFERVNSAETMRAMLDRQAWDIVISDHAMPHFSGPAALAVLRARGLDLPFIIMTVEPCVRSTRPTFPLNRHRRQRRRNEL